MKKPETKFIEAVHKELRSKKEYPYVQAMGSMFMNGTPDRYYEGKGPILWAEYKFIPRAELIRKPYDVNVTPLQNAWLERAKGNNQKAVVIIGRYFAQRYIALIREENFDAPVTPEQFANIGIWGFVSTVADYLITETDFDATVTNPDSSVLR